MSSPAARLRIVALLVAASIAAPTLAAAGSPPDPEQVKRGEYLAKLGDCVACHTAPGGQPMAGGTAMSTPFGVVYSTNVTPDAGSGIGRYTFEQFDAAVRKGVTADGRNLYPAMPYPSFSKIGEKDMRDLYAYFMHGVTPVSKANREADMRWPFSIRLGLVPWNALFAPDQPYAPDPAKSARWNRGAYLVEGLGHCGTCHTPRGLAFQERAFGSAESGGEDFLGGATLDGWHAPSLRHLAPAAETAQFLKTGRGPHAAAYGLMTEVVHFSTQHYTDEDLDAVGQYLASLPPNPASPAPRPVAARQEPAGLYTTRGGLGYVQFCSTCHRADGQGAADLLPPLAQNSSVTSPDATSVIHVVLSGGRSAQTERYPRAFAMPSFSQLTDRELAEILTFMRSSWGNQGPAVTAEQVAQLRGQTEPPAAPGAAFTTPRFAEMLDAKNAAQLVRGMRLMMDTKAQLPEHVGNVLDCSSCHLNAGTMAHASPYVGLAAMFPSYAPRAGRVIDFKDRINGCMLRSMNGKPLPKDSPDILAMVAYVDWLSVGAKPGATIPGRGTGKISESIVPNVENGKQVFEKQCAVCHGRDGEGLKEADGRYAFPPLWGNDTFNIGAGIARTYKAAAFVKSNMPIANTLAFPMGQGGLTDQEAVDVAEYFTHMPRADFAGKVKDWPNGDRPKDARY